MPNGWGEPALYDFEAVIKVDGKVIASQKERIVIRFEKATENQAKVQALGEDGFAQAGGKGDKVISDGVISDKVMWKGERCGIGSVDEVKVNEDGTLSYIRRLNGDQDHQGRHVRISVGDFQILHVKLYEYK